MGEYVDKVACRLCRRVISSEEANTGPPISACRDCIQKLQTLRSPYLYRVRIFMDGQERTMIDDFLSADEGWVSSGKDDSEIEVTIVQA